MRHLLWVGVMGLFILCPLSSQDSGEGDDPWNAGEGASLRLTGVIALVGNEPFTEMVLKTNRGQNYYIQKEDAVTLSSYEQRRLEISCLLHREKQVLANGKELSDRRVIHHIIIIKVLDANATDT